MKKLFITLAGFIFIIACATVPIQNPVCPQEGSWICERSAQLGIQPEQVYGWIYDAAAIAAITDVVKIQDLCEFEQEIADWYLKVFPTISYTDFINEILFRITRYDTQTIMLITNILNRNLLAYNSPQTISTADDIILKKGHVAFRQDMLCY